MHMITDDEPSYHLIALHRWLSARPYRILYVGLDLTLLKYLEDSFQDCWIVRAPAACVARSFIERLKYSLFVFDEELMDTTGRELAAFAGTLAESERTPIVIVKESDELAAVARRIKRWLAVSKEHVRGVAAVDYSMIESRSRLTMLKCFEWG
ncbi:MAG TPA: hypothetical protein VGC89_11395 [Pyrinomonadaceae bacterium]